MTPPKLNCGLCNRKMVKGRRVKVILQWEDPYGDLVTRGTIICRQCATKLSALTKMEVPDV